MRKKLALIGVIVLVIGIAFYFVGFEELTANTSIHTALNEHSGGIWESGEMNMTSSNVLTLVAKNASVSLVPATDISSVNASNVASYAVNPTDHVSSSIGNVATYSGDSGSYYLVAFSPSSPVVTYTLSSSLSTTVDFGLLELAGIVVGIAGFIVMIVGLVLKPKRTGEGHQF